MKREEKLSIIENLKEKINNASNFYLADISGLNAEGTSALRRACFKQDIEVIVAKNTLLQKAFEWSEKEVGELTDVLTGHTSVMFSEVGNIPARLIKDFRKDHDKPILKGAYVEETVYLGHESLEMLTNIKSKNELIGDIVLLLQSPAKNVISALQSGSNIITGVLKTLGEKGE